MWEFCTIINFKCNDYMYLECVLSVSKIDGLFVIKIPIIQELRIFGKIYDLYKIYDILDKLREKM